MTPEEEKIDQALSRYNKAFREWRNANDELNAAIQSGALSLEVSIQPSDDGGVYAIYFSGLRIGIPDNALKAAACIKAFIQAHTLCVFTEVRNRDNHLHSINVSYIMSPYGVSFGNDFALMHHNAEEFTNWFNLMRDREKQLLERIEQHEKGA